MTALRPAQPDPSGTGLDTRRHPGRVVACWWCVRAAEGASLEMMFGVKANGGSNPSTTAQHEGPEILGIPRIPGPSSRSGRGRYRAETDARHRELRAVRA